MSIDPLFPEPLNRKDEWCFNSRKKTSKPGPSDPVVSVVIPSYNQGHFLESAIRSVLLQDYPAVECIVIDGGSKDDSKTVLEHYDPWITYWQSEPDNGQADAINIGLEKSSGEIAMFLNSDDMVFPGAIRRVVNAFAEHPDALVIHGHRVLVDQQGDILGWGYSCKFDPVETGYTIPSECAYWRTHATDTPPRFRPELRFALDLEFFCRLYKMGRFQRIDSFLGYFRVHDDAKSFTMQDVRNTESSQLWREYFETDWDPSRWKSSSNPVRHFLLGLKHGKEVFFPWFLKRLKRIFHKS